MTTIHSRSTAPLVLTLVVGQFLVRLDSSIIDVAHLSIATDLGL